MTVKTNGVLKKSQIIEKLNSKAIDIKTKTELGILYLSSLRGLKEPV